MLGRSTKKWQLKAVTAWFFVSLLAFSLLPASAQAPDSGINLQISPLPILLSADPGKSVSSDLRVRNAGNRSEKLKVTLRTFKAEGETGNVVIADRGPTDTHFDWVSFDRPTFDAPPNVWQTIKMRINVPKDAAFGYYYAVQFERATPTRAGPGQSALEGAVAIFILLDVKNPNAKRTAEIVAFKASKKSYEFLPADFSITTKNTGNVHLAPRGNIFIQRGSGEGKEPISTIEVNPNGGSVLPKSNRVYSSAWSDGFPKYVAKTKDGQEVKDKDGKTEQELKWDFSQVPKLRAGKYTAKMVLVYDDGRRDVPMEASVDFWVIPWRLIGGFLIIAIFMIIGLGSTGRKLYRKIRPAKSTKS